jgi:autotransporter-associated beta strand protein
MRMLRTSLAVSLSALSSIHAFADEGMWLPNALPLAQMKAAYGFEPRAGWADHLQRSAVRFSTGGSGSLVLAGATSYSGSTTLNSGIVQIGAANNLGTTTGGGTSGSAAPGGGP